MVRPRNALLALFPPGTVSPEEASDALRKASGNLEEAKRVIAESKTGSTAARQKEPVKCAPNKESYVLPERLPPKTIVAINNLSDRQYCCVWHVEVFEDGYRPEVARALLARVARHVNPILRERGWRVKRLIESASRSWVGLCTGNGRDDADAASTNIQLNLRTQPSKHCKTFRSFQQVLSVMLHEITHTSIGLEDIHPPAFYELLDEIRQQYYEKLQNGEVALETDDYGCKNIVVTQSGELKTVQEAASDAIHQDLGKLSEGEECGVRRRHRKRRANASSYQSNVPKRRPLLKGAKMIDGRTKAGKLAKKAREESTPQELAARAALARFGGMNNFGNARKDDDEEESSDHSDSVYESEQEEEDAVEPHIKGCVCRSCVWDNILK